MATLVQCITIGSKLILFLQCRCGENLAVHAFYFFVDRSNGGLELRPLGGYVGVCGIRLNQANGNEAELYRVATLKNYEDLSFDGTHPAMRNGVSDNHG